jgi:dTDP-4-dehydrorhamnose reductase
VYIDGLTPSVEKMTSDLRVAVTGASGQLGVELCRQLGSLAVPLARERLDVTDPEQVRRVIAEIRPAVVINTAAYTQVDKAEQEPDLCRRTNAAAVGALANACRHCDSLLVQVSTDYVFSGDPTRKTPWSEDDDPSPRGVYATTKLEGEHLAAACPRHLIVRTCGLYGASPRSSNFVKTMLRLGREGRVLRVVNDQHCTPSYVPDVARGLLYLIHAGAQGVYHVVNAGETTWFDFAREIFRHAGLHVSLTPITTAEYGAPAPRPAYSVLSADKYLSFRGPPLPSWQDALSRYLKL